MAMDNVFIRGKPCNNKTEVIEWKRKREKKERNDKRMVVLSWELIFYCMNIVI